MPLTWKPGILQLWQKKNWKNLEKVLETIFRIEVFLTKSMGKPGLLNKIYMRIFCSFKYLIYKIDFKPCLKLLFALKKF